MEPHDFSHDRPTLPLIEAIELESEAEAEEWVRKLLDSGEDPNAPNPDGERGSLETAWMEGRTEIIRMLLEAGAGLPNRIGFPSYCLLNAPFEASELILKAGYKFESEICMNHLNEPMYCDDSVLQNLIQDGSTKDVERFRRFNILCLMNVFDELGCSALHASVRDEEYADAKWLIENGADVNAACEALIGYTPLDYAVTNCDLPMIRLLLNAGANPNIPTWMWLTAIDRAIEEIPKHPGAREIYRLLCGASTRFPDPVYPDGRTPKDWPPPIPQK